MKKRIYRKLDLKVGSTIKKKNTKKKEEIQFNTKTKTLYIKNMI